MSLGGKFIVDLDGTLISGHRILRGAIEFMRVHGKETIVVSNNSTDSANTLVERLEAVGLAVSPDRVLLAGEGAVEMLREDFPGARVVMIAVPAMVDLARRRGLRVVGSDADVVLVCRDTTFTYDKLALATREVCRGAVLMAANPDLSHPGADGIPVPETGAVLRVIEGISGIRASRIYGKPDPMLYLEAMRRLGGGSEKITVIGDNLHTDVRGATALGLRSILIGSSEQAVAPDLLGAMALLDAE